MMNDFFILNTKGSTSQRDQIIMRSRILVDLKGAIHLRSIEELIGEDDGAYFRMIHIIVNHFQWSIFRQSSFIQEYHAAIQLSNGFTVLAVCIKQSLTREGLLVTFLDLNVRGLGGTLVSDGIQPW